MVIDISSEMEAVWFCIKSTGLSICCGLNCVPKRYVELLTPGAHECDLVENSLGRRNQFKVFLGYGGSQIQ